MGEAGNKAGPREGGGKPTLRTVAEIAGVAVTTVSRALADDPAIARKTRERISEIANKIGYVPDRAAQRLRTGRTNVITLLLDPHDEIINFGTSLIAGLTKALQGTSYHLTITPCFEDEDAIGLVRNIVRNNLADGIVFSRTRPFDERARWLLERDFPFVSHGRTDFGTPHPFVDYDNEAFSREAARRLVARGRRRLTFVPPPRDLTFFQHMNYGFLSAARNAGVDHETPARIDLTSPVGEIRDYFMGRMAEESPPDGIICGGEVSALVVMGALTDLGLSIGEDVDIVAKQTSSIFDHMRPRIDTIYEDLQAAGEVMGTILFKRIAGASMSELQVLHAPGTGPLQ